MRQRAALLRTFLAGREVMLLDEPFGALDALTRQEMQEWLLEIWQDDRKTILFVTHDVEEALFLSDRVYVMSGRPGRIELCVEVSLTAPRSSETTLVAPEFTAMKAPLLEPLREAAAQAEHADEHGLALRPAYRGAAGRSRRRVLAPVAAVRRRQRHQRIVAAVADRDREGAAGSSASCCSTTRG